MLPNNSASLLCRKVKPLSRTLPPEKISRIPGHGAERSPGGGKIGARDLIRLARGNCTRSSLGNTTFAEPSLKNIFDPAFFSNKGKARGIGTRTGVRPFYAFGNESPGPAEGRPSRASERLAGRAKFPPERAESVRTVFAEQQKSHMSRQRRRQKIASATSGRNGQYNRGIRLVCRRRACIVLLTTGRAGRFPLDGALRCSVEERNH